MVRLASSLIVAGLAAGCTPPLPYVCPPTPVVPPASTATLVVHVFSEMTRMPVSGARIDASLQATADGVDVLAPSVPRTAATDPCGTAILEDVPPGIYRVHVAVWDDSTYREYVEVVAGTVTTVDQFLGPYPDLNKPLDVGVTVGAAAVMPRDGVAGSYGATLEGSLLPLTAYRDRLDGLGPRHIAPYYVSITAMMTRAERAPGRTAHDLYGLRGAAGFGWSPTRWIIPYAAVGLDALIVDSTSRDGRDDVGVTLGAEVRAGVLGYLGAHLVYNVSASLLGAVAPGPGDNAGGAVLQAALGWRFVQDR